jgi:hypothetical protein
MKAIDFDPIAILAQSGINEAKLAMQYRLSASDPNITVHESQVYLHHANVCELVIVKRAKRIIKLLKEDAI